MVLNTRARASKITKTPGGSIFQEKVLQHAEGQSKESQESAKTRAPAGHKGKASHNGTGKSQGSGRRATVPPRKDEHRQQDHPEACPSTQGQGERRRRAVPRKSGHHAWTPKEDIQGTPTIEGKLAQQGPQDQDVNSLSNPNSAGALSLAPTSSPAQARQQGEEPAPSK